MRPGDPECDVIIRMQQRACGKDVSVPDGVVADKLGRREGRVWGELTMLMVDGQNSWTNLRRLRLCIDVLKRVLLLQGRL